MRDLTRFLTLFKQYLSQSDSTENCIIQALETCYFMRLDASKLAPKGLLFPYEFQLIDD